MALEEPQENDIVEEINGIQVAFDEQIYEYLKNSSLDLQKTPFGEMISIVSDHASSC